VQLLRALGGALRDEPGALTIRGHTDALQHRRGDGISGRHQQLVAFGGRAEATRQELMRSGLAEERFKRIEGVADREPLVGDNPASAQPAHVDPAGELSDGRSPNLPPC
jgi:chemotaxis protein MotB